MSLSRSAISWLARRTLTICGPRQDGEPLSALADLQEFGIPGQEVRLPMGPSPKRMLPPLSEEPLLNLPSMSSAGARTFYI